ncbi:uncharacterized protein FIBRA_00081 [Fibroporia radiculosa]|uniref:FAD-binding domain-containing protein n=1 Tax=Fibroporia radiculosa TaxID=599839 RepID=J7RG49_9APHY|nr:uncharacterized protein FIBRA_00081 [Fibroporia radiculosa]CCL98087.1 predicted protein [Fibroporia radiculosa]
MTTTSESAKQSFKVALVGGGVCGLACAVGLMKAGVDVEVFEAAAHFKEIGAGIGIGANSLPILKHFGVLDEALAQAHEDRLNMNMFWFISGKTGELFYEYPTIESDYGLGLHRAAILDTWIKFVDPKRTHFNKRCTGVSIAADSSSRSVVHFGDGTTYEADVVIGADGIKSTVRGALNGDVGMHGVVFARTICYRGLIPREKVQAAGVKTDLFSGRPVCYLGDSKHIIVFPVKNSTLINVVAFVADYSKPIGSDYLPPGEPWVKVVPQEEMIQAYDGWGSDAISLLKCIEEPSKWSVHVLYPPLDSYVKGRVALLGDAAHAMLPHLGAGAGQGIEDAYVLVELLKHPQTTTSNIEAVLQAYDRIRRPRAQMVWNGSYRAGRIYDGAAEHDQSPEGVSEDIGRMWDPVIHHDVRDQVQSAVDWLKETLVFT